jgi:hypothetical protein
MRSGLPNNTSKDNWPLRIGWGCTVIWCAAWFVALVWKSKAIAELSWNAIGDTAAGFASPLAFLWLVVGYYLQRQELRLQRNELTLQRSELQRNREESERQTKQMESQALAIRSNEQHARRDSFMRAFELGRHQLAMTAAYLAANFRMADYIEPYRIHEDPKTGINAYADGDVDAPFRSFLLSFDRFIENKQTYSNSDTMIAIVRKVTTNSKIKAAAAEFVRFHNAIMEESYQFEGGDLLGRQISQSALAQCAHTLDMFYQGNPGFESAIMVEEPPSKNIG